LKSVTDDDEIILFTDAYDVYYSGDEETMLKRYLEFDKPIVFGAEQFCHPDKERAQEYPRENSSHYFPYLNSGAFIGRAAALRSCMQDYKYDDAEDDQRFWTTQYLKRPHLITLDHSNKLFLNCAGVNPDEVTVGKFRDATPQVVHANGDEKNAYLKPFFDTHTYKL
jgi:hypothetical protein